MVGRKEILGKSRKFGIKYGEPLLKLVSAGAQYLGDFGG